MRNIYSLSVILESEGMNVVVAHDGQEALGLLNETPGVDIVLMDIMMPGMDGYAAMRAIRKMEKFRRLPILAITAKAMKNDRQRCLDAGASDYLSKPVKADALLAALRKWLPAHAAAPSGQRPDA
jgi:CheY-like chemotaxis protein